MAKTALLTGSNLGERQGFLRLAEDEIVGFAKILKKSNIYESAAWGKVDQPGFLNQALLAETDIGPTELLVRLKTIEKNAGRVTTEKWGERVLDIDILYYDDIILNTPELILPHPYMAVRRFTLMPLAEISEEWVHPFLQKTVKQMLDECRDAGEVKVWNRYSI